MFQVKEKSGEIQGSVKKDILDRYGGAEHMDAPPKELLLGQNETYVEYSRTGKVIKGLEPAAIRSRYVEDVFLNNHTVSVFFYCFDECTIVVHYGWNSDRFP